METRKPAIRDQLLSAAELQERVRALWRFVRWLSMVEGMEREDAEQEIALLCLEAASLYDKDRNTPLSAWIWQYVRNHVVIRLRRNEVRKRRVKLGFTDYQIEIAGESEPEERDPEFVVSQAERLRVFSRALDAAETMLRDPGSAIPVSRKLRTTAAEILIRQRAGVSATEIREELGLSKSNYKYAWAKAREVVADVSKEMIF